MNKKRLLILASLVFFLFSLLLIQFFRIQILQEKKWKAHAENQHYFEVIEPFMRGTIYSNPSVKKGHPEAFEKLALDVYQYHLFADPQAIPESLRKEIVAQIIMKAQPTEKERLQLLPQLEKKSRSRRLISWIDEKKRVGLLAWWRPFAKKHHLETNALYFTGDYKRVHPFGKMLGQVLHTVQERKDEFSQNAYPTGGLEMSLNKYLRGKVGKKRLMRSPRHSLEAAQEMIVPQNGADVYLTINPCLQAICEEEIEKGVKKCKAKSGWAVMMDPDTGEILALAQYPFFYPDDYVKYFNTKELIEETKVKTITDAHEPGSIMKPITQAIVLKANKILKSQGKPLLFHPDEKVDVSSGRFPGRSKPMTDLHVHRYLDMWLAMQKSSNIYYARLVQRLVQQFGDKWYRNELVRFGFGSKTGLELPGESCGLLPRIGKKHPNGRPEWSVPTPFSLAIGYNIQTTSLQMLRAFNVFASGGKLVTPTLVRKIISKTPDGLELVMLNNTKKYRTREFPRILDQDIVKEVVHSMKFVTKRGGTAWRGNIFGYTEAGKTSTDMKLIQGAYSSRKHVTSFIGFAPVSDPVFILLITMDEPLPMYIPGQGLNHRGGMAAAPVFREIGKRTLEYLGVPPDDPHGYPVGDPRYDSKKADMMQELLILEKRFQEWNEEAKNENKTAR